MFDDAAAVRRSRLPADTLMVTVSGYRTGLGRSIRMRMRILPSGKHADNMTDNSECQIVYVVFLKYPSAVGIRASGSLNREPLP